MMVRRSGRYTVNWRGFRDFTFGNKPPDEGMYVLRLKQDSEEICIQSVHRYNLKVIPI